MDSETREVYSVHSDGSEPIQVKKIYKYLILTIDSEEFFFFFFIIIIIKQKISCNVSQMNKVDYFNGKKMFLNL